MGQTRLAYSADVLARAAARLHTIAALVIAATIGALLVAVAPWWFVVLAPLLGIGWRQAALAPYRRRARIAEEPFPPAWREVLEQRVAFYRRLSPAGRGRFEAAVAVFIAEHPIYGPQRAAVPDEVRLLIAAGAAMLTHGRPDWEWPKVRDIVVHPTQFNENYEMGDHHAIAGMVHAQGPVLLSRKQIRFGFRKSDGENVVVHELAHVLDLADGDADGAPAGFAWRAIPGWDALIKRRLKAVRRGEGGPLRAYAGTDSAETFAVATEVFFEQPERLRKRDPELYEALATLYNLDPDTGEMRVALR